MYNRIIFSGENVSAKNIFHCFDATWRAYQELHFGCFSTDEVSSDNKLPGSFPPYL
jgi:hypothetical protein